MADERREIELEAGTIRYREAGSGPPLVFVHGYLVDGRIWDGVVDRLADRFRCIAPDWPIGAHRTAMNADADLTPPGIAALIAALLAQLELEDVTIVGNDSGGAMSQVLVSRHPERIAALVLTNCDTHENFPPGVFKHLSRLANLPGGMTLIALPFRSQAICRRAFRAFARRPIPDQLIASWMAPAQSDPGIKRDLKKVTVGMHRRYTLEAAERLRGSRLPILLAWAPGDKYFPIVYAERLAGEVGNADLVRIPDSSTFVSWDQPEQLSEEIARFARTG